ncbi:MAG: hypothetical protein GC171_12855 [Terrimonas sp.]|nr:hypothetical protein [Terrimonas sp.]
MQLKSIIIIMTVLLVTLHSLSATDRLKSHCPLQPETEPATTMDINSQAGNTGEIFYGQFVNHFSSVL